MRRYLILKWLLSSFVNLKPSGFKHVWQKDRGYTETESYQFYDNQKQERGKDEERENWKGERRKEKGKKGKWKRKNERISLNTVLFHPQNRYCAYHSLHDSNLPWNSLAHLYNRIISKMSFDILPIAMSPLICMNLWWRLWRSKAGAIS